MKSILFSLFLAHLFVLVLIVVIEDLRKNP
jgi:hypothetical protein